MKKIIMTILVSGLILVGCENKQQQQSEFEPLSEQIEQVKAPAQTQQTSGVEPTGDIKISVTMLIVDERDFAALDSLWQYTTSSFIWIKRPDLFPESGLRVQRAGGDLSIKLTAVSKQARYCRLNEMFLVLADGATGYIDIGTQIAVPQFHYLTRWYKATDYDFKRAGRGFKVTARRIQGRDLVHLRLLPVLSRFLSDGGDKEFTELTTALTVKPGESILVGGSRTSQESLATALLGLSRETRQKDMVILVNVSLL